MCNLALTDPPPTSLAHPPLAAARRGIFQKNVSEPLRRFIADSSQFLAECERPALTSVGPSSKQRIVPDFVIIAGVTGVGFVAFGLIAFLVKVVHAPITQILLG